MPRALASPSIPTTARACGPDAEAAKQAIGQALATTDIALPTFPDEQALFGDENFEDTAKRLESLGVAEIVVKDGEAPALILHYGDRHHAPATNVATPVDTTGAGDSFNGAYLAARLAGDAPVEGAAARASGSQAQSSRCAARSRRSRCCGAAFNG